MGNDEDRGRCSCTDIFVSIFVGLIFVLIFVPILVAQEFELEVNTQETCEAQNSGVAVCSDLFVNLHPSRRIPIVNGDYSASIIRHAPELRRVLKVCQYQPSVREQAIQLGIPPGGRVLFARRFDFLGEAVTAVDEVVVPAAFADMLQEQELRDFDFLERLYAVHKLPLDYESQALESLPAAAPVTEWLAVPPGAPLLKETNLVYLVGGTVLALFVSYYRHEFYQFKSISRIEDRGYSRRFGGI
ncbi:MAG: UTRA domain-containing protein [Lentisphaerae bacterium]|nr:UTRA domain-containing protein [Lentisphaerota bacterium]